MYPRRNNCSNDRPLVLQMVIGIPVEVVLSLHMCRFPVYHELKRTVILEDNQCTQEG